MLYSIQFDLRQVFLAPLDGAHWDLYFDIKKSHSPKMPLTPLWLQALDM